MAVHDTKPVSWVYNKLEIWNKQAEILVSCGILKVNENMLIGGNTWQRELHIQT